MIDEVVLSKASNIQRCVKRVLAEYDGKTDNLRNQTKQDSIVLNLQRACELSIDIAMHLAKKLDLGRPQSSRDAFEKLASENLISANLLLRMKNMVGFRNIAIHDYISLKLEIIENIITNNLGDFADFIDSIKDL